MADEKIQPLSTPPQTLIVPSINLKPTAAFGWLCLAWRDLRKSWGVSLLFGFFVFLMSITVAGLAWVLGGFVLLISMLSGFVFIAPILAFGLYSVSRQLCEGKQVSIAHTLHAIRQPMGNAMVFTLVLLVIFLLWARAGLMVQVFFPYGDDPQWVHVVTFLSIGSAVGSVFAMVSFAATAFSLPLLANRDLDVITAVVSSINAVLRNKPAMFIWAILICVLILFGFLTAGLGLIVVIPLLAYASWHAYRETLDLSQLHKLG